MALTGGMGATERCENSRARARAPKTNTDTSAKSRGKVLRKGKSTVRAKISRSRERTPTTNTNTKQGSDMEYGATRARIANRAVFLARYIENPLSGAPAT